MIHRLHLAWHRFQEWRFIRHAERTTGLKTGVWMHDPDRDYGLTVTGEWTEAEPSDVIGTAQLIVDAIRKQGYEPDERVDYFAVARAVLRPVWEECERCEGGTVPMNCPDCYGIGKVRR